MEQLGWCFPNVYKNCTSFRFCNFDRFLGQYAPVLFISILGCCESTLPYNMLVFASKQGSSNGERPQRASILLLVVLPNGPPSPARLAQVGTAHISHTYITNHICGSQMEIIIDSICMTGADSHEANIGWRIMGAKCEMCNNFIKDETCEGQ